MKMPLARILAAAKKMPGYYDFQHDKSRLSQSEYLDVVFDDPNNEAGRNFKFRYSSHEMRPTYGAKRGYAGFEVGTHQDADGDWKAAVDWLARQVAKLQ